MIRVAIVADTRLYREGLAQVLGRDAGLCVVATAARGDEALAALPDLQADVILVDMAMPESRGVVRVILERAPLSRVIALGVVEDEDDVLGWAEAGVAGAGHVAGADVGASRIAQVRRAKGVSRAKSEATCGATAAQAVRLRLGSGSAGSAGHLVRRRPAGSGEIADERGPATPLLAGREPGPTGQLHGQRDCGRRRVPGAEEQGALRQREPPLHLLQRASDRAHDQVRLGCDDPRRHQDGREAGRLLGAEMAVRGVQVRPQANGAVL